MRRDPLSNGRHDWPSNVGSPRSRERGQTTAEFALILLPLLTIVTGIIWFGIGLNYWLDMQRIANQGARWAAVNNWPPDCPRGDTSCSLNPPCTASPAARRGASLTNTLRCQALTNGVRSSVQVEICYLGGKTQQTVAVGDSVRVRLTLPYTFFFVDRVGVTLSGSATMRLEQRPTLISEGGPCP